jgi:hypothetical protein
VNSFEKVLYQALYEVMEVVWREADDSAQIAAQARESELV